MKRFANLITAHTLLIVVLGLLIVFPFGCSKKELEPKVIKIGAILPLTGDNAVYGIAIKNGIELGAEEINKNGGVNGKKITVIFEDDRAEPSQRIHMAYISDFLKIF